MQVRVSNKGQVTIPAVARRKMGIEPNSLVEVTVTDKGVNIRPVKPLTSLAGALAKYAKPGEAQDWDAIRQETENAVAEEVVSANARRVRDRR
ncbi:MAG: AbrB/MazE/SpoVT family DNA-binding domain-containing protein [Armatimonadetes bacterium]|jgi:AbrB family looped-hinge helix DNA binding protein|nr:AbrB/MazE/SpoVT family DNA-binding domain-containing protein [Armatimonadota bacterium]MDI9584255.1 AbrB/MazE/SpoVT family DNA-binding domain-containing protein [Acidobacteriota bacterium]